MKNSLGEKVNSLQNSSFETHIVPLHVAAALALIYLYGTYLTWFFLTHPATVQQQGLTVFAWVTYVVFASSLFAGVVTLAFSKLEINEESVTVIPAFMQILRYKGFPYSFRFERFT